VKALKETTLFAIAVTALMALASHSASSQPSGSITVAQVSPGRIALHLSCTCTFLNPHSFLVTVSDRAIQIVTVFGDTGLPVTLRTVEVGPLSDGPYSVTWIETVGHPGVSIGEQYLGSFTLVRGVLVDDAAPIPASSPAVFAMLFFLIAVTAFSRLNGTRVRYR